MTYYGFEIVQSTVTTDSGINVIITIPVHHTTGATRGLSSDPVSLTRRRGIYGNAVHIFQHPLVGLRSVRPKCQAISSRRIVEETAA